MIRLRPARPSTFSDCGSEPGHGDKCRAGDCSRCAVSPAARVGPTSMRAFGPGLRPANSPRSELAVQSAVRRGAAHYPGLVPHPVRLSELTTFRLGGPAPDLITVDRRPRRSRTIGRRGRSGRHRGAGAGRRIEPGGGRRRHRHPHCPDRRSAASPCEPSGRRHTWSPSGPASAGMTSSRA